jgi:REP element-mobilizing transposase RayT
MPELPASHRLRIGRFSEPNRIYLITTNTHERTPIFSDFHLGRLVFWQLRVAQYQGLANSLAWVIMPDPFHWLLELQKGSLADLMCQVKSKSTRNVNGVTGRKGRLWQESFHDRALRKEDDLVKMAR